MIDGALDQLVRSIRALDIRSKDEHQFLRQQSGADTTRVRDASAGIDQNVIISFRKDAREPLDQPGCALVEVLPAEGVDEPGVFGIETAGLEEVEARNVSLDDEIVQFDSAL